MTDALPPQPPSVPAKPNRVRRVAFAVVGCVVGAPVLLAIIGGIISASGAKGASTSTSPAPEGAATVTPTPVNLAAKPVFTLSGAEFIAEEARVTTETAKLEKFIPLRVTAARIGMERIQREMTVDCEQTIDRLRRAALREPDAGEALRSVDTIARAFAINPVGNRPKTYLGFFTRTECRDLLTDLDRTIEAKAAKLQALHAQHHGGAEAEIRAEMDALRQQAPTARATAALQPALRTAQDAFGGVPADLPANQARRAAAHQQLAGVLADCRQLRERVAGQPDGSAALGALDAQISAATSVVKDLEPIPIPGAQATSESAASKP